MKRPTTSRPRVWKRPLGILAAAALALSATMTSPASAVGKTVTATIRPSGHTEYCLDSSFAGGVYLGKCNGGDYQKWKLYRKEIPGYNPVKLRNVATGMCLDQSEDSRGIWGGGKGSIIYTHKCNDGDRQRWEDLKYGSNLRSLGKPTHGMSNRWTGDCLHMEFTWYGTPLGVGPWTGPNLKFTDECTDLTAFKV